MDYEVVRRCNKRGGIWKVIAIILFFAFALMTVSAFLLKKKNDEYRNALIEESSNFPITPEQEIELKEIRKREWRRKHALKNRKTTEERMAENRVEEAE